MSNQNSLDDYYEVTTNFDINSSLLKCYFKSNSSNFTDIQCAEWLKKMIKESKFGTPLEFLIPIVVLCALVMISGAIGNIFVVVVMIKTKKLWNATNIFLTNLAIMDVFVVIFDLPLSIYYQLYGDWIFGKVLCHLMQPAFAVVVYGSSLTLMAIAIDRYRLIVHPTRQQISNKRALMFVAIIFLLSTLIALPIGLHSHYTKGLQSHYSETMLSFDHFYCTESWSDNSFKIIYTIFLFMSQFVIPLCLIITLYIKIFKKIQLRINRRNKDHSKLNRPTTMMMAVVTVFAITWIPYHIFTIIVEVEYDLIKGPYFTLIDALFRIFAMSSSCINPILYTWMNEAYRKAFLGLFCKGATKYKTNFTEQKVTSKLEKNDKTDITICKSDRLNHTPLLKDKNDVESKV